MFATLLDVFSKGAVEFVNIVTSPIDLLVSNLFPNMSQYISNFNYFVSHYIGSTVAYFSNMLPPMTKNVIAFWLTFMIGYYAVAWSYTLIVKAFNVIQKIKFW